MTFEAIAEENIRTRKWRAEMPVLTMESINSVLSGLSMDSLFCFILWRVNSVLSVWELKMQFGKSSDTISMYLFTKLKKIL